MHRAIGEIGEMFRKCSLILTGAAWMTLELVIQKDWKAIFRTHGSSAEARQLGVV
jgi:hypothetical protein